MSDEHADHAATADGHGDSHGDGHGDRHGGHGDDHGHGGMDLGPIDWRMWGIGVLGTAIGLVAAVCFGLTTGLLHL